jgi:microcompartment protein CcmK/EutM
MNLGVVHGVVVCEQREAGLIERRLVLVQPVDERGTATGRVMVALDPIVSASEGSLVWFVSGSDATDALADPFQSADAAVVGLVSSIRTASGP